MKTKFIIIVEINQATQTPKYISATTPDALVQFVTHPGGLERTIASLAIDHRAPDVSSLFVMSASSIAPVTTFSWPRC